MKASIQLNKSDLDQVCLALEKVVIYKSTRLSPENWTHFSKTWVPSILNHIEHNCFPINHPTKNSLYWLMDQIKHSKIKYKNKLVPLERDISGQVAIEIIQAALLGQKFYDRVRNSYGHLFEV